MLNFRKPLIFLCYLVSTLYIFPNYALADNPGPAGVQQLEQLIQRLINIVVELAFIACLFMLIWGGIRYLTSGGESKAVEQANHTISWALLGILFLAIAWLVLLIVKALTGVDVTQFSIGFPGVNIPDIPELSGMR